MQDILAAQFTGFDIAIFVAVFALIVVLGSMLGSKGARRRPWRGRHFPYRPGGIRRNSVGLIRPVSASPQPSGVYPTDPAEQLRVVMAADFRKKRILSKAEARVMEAADAAIAEAGVQWRVMAQVALGEVLSSNDEAAFYSINAKRVDLLIVSEKSDPIAAIEYQGQGHYQGSAPARDAIKKEALRKAGVGYIEITHEHWPEDVRREIARLALVKSRDPKDSMQKITGA
jgi:Protein of unknown function (DUF2726)